MLSFDKVSKVYFSPSGTTKRVVDEIAKNFELSSETFDLLSFEGSKTFNNELVIVGMPSFDGRIPEIARDRLMGIKGNNTKVVAVVNYGNLDYGDSLLELTELLKNNGFEVIGAALTVSQHSLFNEIGLNRPDASDLNALNEFSDKLIEKLSIGNQNEIFVQGQKPYHDYVIHSFDVDCDEDLCVYCNDCVYTCPVEAIEENDPIETDLDLCVRCSVCVHICSEHARSFQGSEYELEKEKSLNENVVRNEVEFFI